MILREINKLDVPSSIEIIKVSFTPLIPYLLSLIGVLYSFGLSFLIDSKFNQYVNIGIQKILNEGDKIKYDKLVILENNINKVSIDSLIQANLNNLLKTTTKVIMILLIAIGLEIMRKRKNKFKKEYLTFCLNIIGR